MSLKDNLTEILKNIPNHVVLVAVSKTKPVELINELYHAGQLDFGENRVQELNDKHEHLPKDIRWHLIGHLQKNKVKYIAPYVHSIHSVDSLELLQEIDKQALKNNRIIRCLLQFHIAEEETKFGLNVEEATNIIQHLPALKNVQINGVMGMATFTDNEEKIRQEFKALKSIFDFFKLKYFPLNDSFRTISMGMSNDYTIAIEEGSNMVRIGSSIFK